MKAKHYLTGAWWILSLTAICGFAGGVEDNIMPLYPLILSIISLSTATHFVNKITKSKI